MATTTPNFGWSVPTSTDLVKDGATAIETLGDSIDASLVDLKGGTTNQVLAKNSDTDMDFKWVADAQGIPATIFDAKGDLIAASAADTAARLAVGANFQILTADSTAATGLSYTGDWIAYTPSWTSSGTSPAIGNGTLTGGYRRIGQQIDFWMELTAGSTTTFGTGSWRFSLPINATTSQWNYAHDVMVLDTGTTWYKGLYGVGVDGNWNDRFEILTSNYSSIVQQGTPMTWTTGDGIRVMGRYRQG
jgi:hypothetical protein